MTFNAQVYIDLVLVLKQVSQSYLLIF